MMRDITANTRKTRKRQKRSWSDVVLARIADLANSDLSGAEIHRRLEAEARSGRAAFVLTDVPMLRTVQSIVAKQTPRVPSNPWSLADADADEGLVMPVWREVIEHTEGRVTQITRGEAQWIARVRRSAPEPYPYGLSYWDVYLLAREYVLLTERGEPTTGADAYLAYAPWRSIEAAFRYDEALKAGRIPHRLFPRIDMPGRPTSEDTNEGQVSK